MAIDTMFNINTLRISITLLWLAIIGVLISEHNLEISSYVLQAQNIIAKGQPPPSNTKIVLSFITLVLLVYSSAALWACQESGKWIFILYAILLVAFQNEVVIFNRFQFLFTELTNIITGAILVMLFTSPLQEQLKMKKPFVTITSILAFIVFTGLIAIYLTI